VQFRSPAGKLYAEEVFGTQGFSGTYSILYHRSLPPQMRTTEFLRPTSPQGWTPSAHRNRHLRTRRLAADGDPVTGRRALLFNDDLVISLAAPDEPQGALYKNGTRDELLFVHEGEGALITQFGELPFHAGDYVYIPRGTVQQLCLEGGRGRLLVIEAAGTIATPHRYRNADGQLLEHAPYWERDFRKPERLVDQHAGVETPRELHVKIGDEVHRQLIDHDPFDVVGWDGYCYPFAFSIHDFEPIAGRLHVPPTAHQTFEGPGFVVCSFVPRLLDWDPNAVPVPYYHENLDSDEVIYYVAGTYGARKVEPGSITLHPRGLAHGPSAGAVEASLEAPRRTDELAVMVDTFRPPRMTAACEALDDPAYIHSWDESHGSPQ
jgi:homogentisate 1,2-dioxygenase